MAMRGWQRGGVVLSAICLLGFAVFLLGPLPDKANVITSFLGAHTSAASGNSCSNVVVKIGRAHV